MTENSSRGGYRTAWTKPLQTRASSRRGRTRSRPKACKLRTRQRRRQWRHGASRTEKAGSQRRGRELGKSARHGRRQAGNVVARLLRHLRKMHPRRDHQHHPISPADTQTNTLTHCCGLFRGIATSSSEFRKLSHMVSVHTLAGRQSLVGLAVMLREMLRVARAVPVCSDCV